MSTPDSPVTLTVKDAYDMYNRHTESAHKLWAYYSAVSLAVLGYMVNTSKVNWSAEMFLLIAGGYAIFALSNLWILRITQAECVAFASVLNTVANPKKTKSPVISVKSTPVLAVTFFHAFVLATVLTSIYATWLEPSTARNKVSSKEAPSVQMDSEKNK